MIAPPIAAPRRPLEESTPRDRFAFRHPSGDVLTALAVFIVVVLAYNSNGREIRTYDSRPTELAARALLANGTLTLDRDVAETPEYARRWGFIRARDGHYRSIYSPVPALAAAALTWPLTRTGLIDVDAPMAPQLIAKVAASSLVAAAVVLAYLTVRRRLSRRLSLLIVVGLGLGTGYWSSASQTLWQSETAVFGLSLAVLLLSRAASRLPRRASIPWASAIALGAALALAVTARPQLAPTIAVLLVGTAWCLRLRTAALAAAVVVAAAGVLAVMNARWFGDPLGALPLLTSVNAEVHDTGPSFALNAGGYLGLLFSPSRGLIVFSPVALVALAGSRAVIRGGLSHVESWCLLAAAAQFLVYGSYSVWWGGHTFGPRYMIDVLPLLVPAAAVALARHWSSTSNNLAALALVWSIAVAATGAFCYPNDAWNTNPTDVDRDHARLWSIADNQILRCWKMGVSPQTFRLVSREAFRRTPRDARK